MIQNPILKVLSTMQRHRVQCLLMGGQACVFYGGAQFSRDVDLAIFANDENLRLLKSALDELNAEVMDVPNFEIAYLHRGHAIHFRCQHSDAIGMRIDVMSSMRGLAPFLDLWDRRTTFETPDGTICDLLGLSDLVQSKKTQRDKDWPIIRRLVEAHYFENAAEPSEQQVRFWLRQLRTPEILAECATRWQEECSQEVDRRPLLLLALAEEEAALEASLLAEEREERLRDKDYWQPLRAELAAMRER